MKLQGKSLREIADMLQAEGITSVRLWTTPVANAIRRTALGHRWTPHTELGPHSFLNIDELRELVRFADNNPEGVGLPEMCDEAANIKERNRIGITDSLMMSVPSIADQINNIASVTRSWAVKTCKGEGLRIVSPELLEVDRWLYASTAVVQRWLDSMEPHLRGIPEAPVFNFDESMVLVSRGGKVVVHHDRKVSAANAENKSISQSEWPLVRVELSRLP